MPLIILTGFPCAGKSRRAAQLQSYFLETRPQYEGRAMQVHVVDEHVLRIQRDAFDAPVTEKMARGALLSAVERLLAKDAIVIADDLNYIKGFRYQLYCVARAISTPHCVMHCGIPADVARGFNEARGAAGGPTYNPKTLDNLISRYEEPDGRNRWDAPLFNVLYDDESLPFSAIVEAVILRKPPPPNLSTVVTPVSETNYLHELDQTTQDIVAAVMDAQRSGSAVPGSLVSVPRAKSKIHMPGYTVTPAELRRLRRQFININKQRTMTDLDRLADLFARYLSDNLNSA
ncbi:kti12, chromatin associated [Sorochytrium milnesiophthora]